MLNNMYNDYDNECINYYTTSTFDRRNRLYLLSRYTPKAIWDYKDTLSIEFDLKECPLTDDKILEELEGKYVQVHFYNFRFEEIPFTYEAPAVEHFTVSIDYETSNKYFDRGTYNCSVELVTYSDAEEKTVLEYNTILPREWCSFYVK